MLFRAALLALFSCILFQLHSLNRKADELAGIHDDLAALSTIRVTLQEVEHSLGYHSRTLADSADTLRSISSSSSGLASDFSAFMKSQAEQAAERDRLLTDISSAIERTRREIPDLNSLDFDLDPIYDLLEEKYFPARFKQRLKEEEQFRLEQEKLFPSQSPVEFTD